MPISLKKTNSVEEYKDLVERFSYYVNKGLEKAEDLLEKGEIGRVIHLTPQLVSMINVVGYFRGEGSVIIDLRPNDTISIQSDLYANEDGFEKRLGNIIDKINASGEKNASDHKQKLTNYFVKVRARDKNDPPSW